MRKHLPLLVGSLVLIGGGCFGSADTSSGLGAPALSKSEQAALMANCTIKDKDLCKFWTSWREMDDYQALMTTTEKSGKKTAMRMVLQEGGKRSSITGTENGQENFATVSIGTVSYTKDYADGKWFKFDSGPVTEAAPDAVELEKPEEQFDFEFDDSAAEPNYKNLGKEACGSLTCFKYETSVMGSELRQFIWFDDKDYVLRKTRDESQDGMVTEAEFSYGKTAPIVEPSPVKIMPGFNADGTAPDYSQMNQADLEKLQQEYMQQFGADGIED